jgi:uncharacterized protein (DUF952 family)
VTIIYKIMSETLWRLAETSGVFHGAPVDATDGYIHFSTAEQVEATAAKHFAGARDLVLVAVEAEALDAPLKWEPARAGALFPHLYGPLPLTAVRWMRRIPTDANGAHSFKGLLP